MYRPDYIYQSFFFDYGILKYFYAGNQMSRYRKDMTPGELLNLAYEMMADDGITPELVSHIENIIGTENCIYDFWEFGPDCFSLYWFIHKTVYREKIAIINAWIEFEELEDFVDFYDHSEELTKAK